MANINPLAYTGRVLASTKRLGDAEFNPDSFSVSENGVVSIAGELVDITLIASPAGQDLDIKMGDAAGANKISFLDSASVEVASLDSNGVFTAPQVNSLIFDTNVAAAGVTLQGTTLAADGTDANISITLTPKGTGDLLVTVGDINASAGDIIASRSAAGADVTVEVTNSNNASGTANAFFEAAVGGASGGDAGIRFQISGGQNWAAGLDNSDSDAFVLSEGNAIGTTNALRIAPTSRDVSIESGNLIISGAAKQLQVNGGAATDFIGQVTLVAGVGTILNTNIAATDRVFVTRQGVNGSTGTGVFDVTITPATSFVITSLRTDGSTETNDTSIVNYFIVRQI